MIDMCLWSMVVMLLMFVFKGYVNIVNGCHAVWQTIAGAVRPRDVVTSNDFIYLERRLSRFQAQSQAQAAEFQAQIAKLTDDNELLQSQFSHVTDTIELLPLLHKAVSSLKEEHAFCKKGIAFLHVPVSSLKEENELRKQENAFLRKTFLAKLSNLYAIQHSRN